MIDYTKFRLSLQRLAEQEENHRTLDRSLPELTREGVAESVIQRFETCYDCLWKVLRRHLEEELGVMDAPYSPKPVLRLAQANDLLETPVQQWFRYVKARIGTTHDYDGAKARAALELIPDFLDDAIALYETMTGEPWDPNAP